MPEVLGLKGEFRLLHKIGEGGMADVFLAERMGADGFRTRVALKRLHRGLAMDTYFIRQLVREARLLGQLEHANIVKVYDLRKIGEEYYVVMEYVDGVDLAAVARVHRTRKTRIPRPFFFHVALALSEALAYAHAAVDPSGNPTPLIHRDIKPSNVMLSRRGVVKLTDFGIAHVGDGSVTGGLVQGTANYMSPEQAFGEERLTPASDVYSLGSVFYEMLTGKGLVDGDNYLKAIHQVRQRRVTVEELAQVGVEPGLRMVIAKMLAADLDRRYGEMDSVRNDLQFVADRLKVDLSWHRIRSYVGRVLGILGRAPDRATLSNLKVAPEVQSTIERLPNDPVEAQPSAPPEPPADPVRPELDSDVSVTKAVRKDLLDVALSSVAEAEEDELELVGSQASGPMPVQAEEEADTEETLYQAEQASASELLASAAMSSAPISLSGGDIDEPTSVAPNEDWAVGPQPPLGDSDSLSSWGEGDEENTQIYQGRSPRETGVIGTFGSGKPEDDTPTDRARQIGPDSSPAISQQQQPPASRPAARPPGSESDMWVFDEATSGLRPASEVLAEPPARPKKRRRKRSRKNQSRTYVLVAMFVLFLIAVFIILLYIAYDLRASSPPSAEIPVEEFEAPGPDQDEADLQPQEPSSG
ncbi:MAG: serine/threonine-protein kinase [Myxococcota bacterium]|nr:serine/threonine-protein kinase [Myxococcota bacterium]